MNVSHASNISNMEILKAVSVRVLFRNRLAGRKESKRPSHWHPFRPSRGNFVNHALSTRVPRGRNKRFSFLG